MSYPRPRIVLISGSLRQGSVNSAVVRTAAMLAPPSVEPIIYGGMADLPHFNPDDDVEPLPAPVAALRGCLDQCDGVFLSTPEYVGSLSGSFKNLIDWTVGSGGLYQRPVGWINAAPQGGARDAHQALRAVLDRAGTQVIPEACRDLPVPRHEIGADGLVASAILQAAIAEVIRALACAACARAAERMGREV